MLCALFVPYALDCAKVMQNPSMLLFNFDVLCCLDGWLHCKLCMRNGKVAICLGEGLCEMFMSRGGCC